MVSCNPAVTDLSGLWTFTMDPDFRGNPAVVTCKTTQHDHDLTVRCGSATLDKIGTVKGRKVEWRSQAPANDPLLFVTFTGEADRSHAEISGTWSLPLIGEIRRGRFGAKKQK